MLLTPVIGNGSGDRFSNECPRAPAEPSSPGHTGVEHLPSSTTSKYELIGRSFWVPCTAPGWPVVFSGQRSPGRQRIQNGNHARSNYGHRGGGRERFRVALALDAGHPRCSHFRSGGRFSNSELDVAFRNPRGSLGFLSGYWEVRRPMAGFLCQIAAKYSGKAQPILLEPPA